MKLLLGISICCLLAGGAMAQRGGGGHGGGMGGGFHGGGSMGGGMRGGFGGSMGGMRGGGFGGSVGGFRGGSWGGFRGGSWGGNWGGFRGGWGWGRGIGFRGWGWNYPWWGYGLSVGYWPGFYSGFYGYPYDYGYPYYDGGSYDPYAYSYTPTSTVMYPSAQSAPSNTTVVIQQPPVHSTTHVYDEYGQEITGGGGGTISSGPSASPIYLIALKDQNAINAALSYHVDGNTLVYVTLQHEEKRVPLSSVNRDLTLRLNHERRVQMSLP